MYYVCVYTLFERKKISRPFPFLQENYIMDLLREFRDPSSVPLLDGFLKSSIRLRTKRSNVISFEGISIGRNEIIIKGEESVGVFRSISSLR